MDIQAWADRLVPEETALIRELCAIPAFSGFEAARAEYISDWLRRCGGEPFIDGAGSVCLLFGADLPGGLRVYSAHMDTVFPMDTALTITETETRLCAPGVGDDTANVAALMLLARHWLETGAKPVCPVLMAWNTGEEGLGNLRGVREICRVYGGRMAQLITFDGTYRRVVDRAVGSLRWQVSVRTEGGHSYAAFGNRNAIHQAAELIHALYLMRVPAEEHTKTTYNVGTITGGHSVNSIAEEAAFTFECRSDRQDCLDVMRGMFEGILAGYRAMGWDIGVTVLGERPCMGAVDPDRHEALLAACETDIAAVTGEQPTRGSSSTDANIPLSLGIPATSFGLYIGGQSHTIAEWLDKGTLAAGLRIGLRVTGRAFEA